jgi:hypothetical protein
MVVVQSRGARFALRGAASGLAVEAYAALSFSGGAESRLRQATGFA